MTQLTTAMIPSSCTTVESLAVWCAEVLQYLYADKKTVEVLRPDGQPDATNVVGFQKYYLTAPDVPEWRYIGRLSIALRKEHLTTGKAWENTRTLGDETVPVSMKT